MGVHARAAGGEFGDGAGLGTERQLVVLEIIERGLGLDRPVAGARDDENQSGIQRRVEGIQRALSPHNRQISEASQETGFEPDSSGPKFQASLQDAFHITCL